jgi:hypothetical protein
MAARHRFAGPIAIALLSWACGGETTAPPTVPTPTVASTTPAPPEAKPDASTPGAADTKTLFVREMRVDCEGEGPRKCLQVRESESGEWTLFYSRIKGFQYEEGTKYELRVSVEKVPKPMADASSLSYTLVEIVSQQKVAPKK